jgi:hypothetical protein
MKRIKPQAASEVTRGILLVPRDGIEPTTPAFSVMSCPGNIAQGACGAS